MPRASLLFRNYREDPVGLLIRGHMEACVRRPSHLAREREYGRLQPGMRHLDARAMALKQEPTLVLVAS